METSMALKTKKSYVIPRCIFGTFGLLLITGQLLHISMLYNSIVGFSIFFVSSYLFIKNNREYIKEITITSIVSIVVLLLLDGIIEGITPQAIPYITSIIVGCVAAYFFSRWRLQLI